MSVFTGVETLESEDLYGGGTGGDGVSIRKKFEDRFFASLQSWTTNRSSTTLLSTVVIVFEFLQILSVVTAGQVCLFFFFFFFFFFDLSILLQFFSVVFVV